MKTYEAEAVTAQINGHETAAIAFMQIAESDPLRLKIEVETMDNIFRLSVPVSEKQAREVAYHFFLEMYRYHMKQRARWEAIRDGIDPDAVIGLIEKK